MDFAIKKVLVTGSAGFIGFYLARKLLDNNIEVIGLDNLNPYYDPELKRARLAQLTPHASYRHINLDSIVFSLVNNYGFKPVIRVF